METITVNENDLKILKRKFKEACENNKEQFTFLGRDILKTYAKYLIQYLDSRFKN